MFNFPNANTLSKYAEKEAVSYIGKLTFYLPVQA